MDARSLIFRALCETTIPAGEHTASFLSLYGLLSLGSRVMPIAMRVLQRCRVFLVCNILISVLGAIVVEPTLVIGLDIGPAWLKLCAEIPQELACYGLIKNVGGAISEGFDVLS